MSQSGGGHGLTAKRKMSETSSFVDPVFLARFGLTRFNAIDYFLHPLNPFRTKAKSSNEVLNMQVCRQSDVLMCWRRMCRVESN